MEDIGEEISNFDLSYIYQRHKPWAHSAHSLAMCIMAIESDVSQREGLNLPIREILATEEEYVLKMGDELLEKIQSLHLKFDSILIEEIFHIVYYQRLLELLRHFNDLINALDDINLDLEDHDIHQTLADFISILSAKDYTTNSLIDKSIQELKNIWIAYA